MAAAEDRDPWARDVVASVDGSSGDDDDDGDAGQLYARPHSHCDGGRKPLLPVPATAAAPDPALLQYRSRKTEVLQRQDEVLDHMHSSARQLWHVTSQISGQFDEHAQIVAELDDDVDASQNGFDAETRKMAALQAAPWYDSCMSKVVCILVLAILALLLVWFVRR